MCRLSTKARAFILIAIFGFIFAYSALQVRGMEEKEKTPPAQSYTVSRAVSPIKIDGVLDEKAWENTAVVELPYEYYPADNVPPPVKTECLITFSKTKLYIAFRCYDPDPGKIRVHLMDRDDIAGFLQDDFVAVTIDTFNDERRGFEFVGNPMGVQADAVVSELDGSQDFTWDAIWNSAGKITDFGYVVEMAVPFNQLRFPGTEGKQTWGFSIERSYPRNTIYNIASHVVDRNISCVLCQANKITGFENMTQGRNLEFDPTLTAVRTDQRENFPTGDMEAGKIKVEPGLSARWGITPNLTLNAAVNPDFSQVEADAAQLEVNTRFALRYPEKRPFFLEGKDFFSTPLEIVFTRTVYDPLWGMKMTGKLGKSAIGIFAAQDRHNTLLFPSNQGSFDTSLEENVFGGVVRYRRDVGKGSTLGFLYTGRVGEDYYNHVAGLDGFIRFSKTKAFSFQLLRSSTDYPDGTASSFGLRQDAFAGNGIFANLKHAGRNLVYSLEYEDLSENFRADYGFISRVDIRRLKAYFEPIIWGKRGGWFERITLKVMGERITDHDGTLTDSEMAFSVAYVGPLQLFFQPFLRIKKEFYNGITYDLNKVQTIFQMAPVGNFNYYLIAVVGDTIDYSNSRKADSVLLMPGIEWRIGGGHLNVTLNHIYERVTLETKKIYTANLFQARLGYHFNVRTFFRAIVQYTDVSRNVDLFTFPVEARSKYLFTQFLFSYKVNPQTVLFLGYSDNHFGGDGIELTRGDRTFFLKIGYALAL